MLTLFFISALLSVICATQASTISVVEEYNLALDNALFNPDEYVCSICIDIVRQLSKAQSTYEEMCEHYKACKIFDGAFAQEVAGLEPSDCEEHYRSTCENRGYCMKGEYKKWRHYAEREPAVSLNLRVAKAYGARGHDKIRISVISNHSISNSLFTYSKQFQYRWTQFYLNTGVVSVTAGVVNQYNIDGQAVKVYVPKDDEGTRGVIIADPCFQSQWVSCKYQTTFDTLNRMTALLNAVNSHDDTHYWMILGYEHLADGSITIFFQCTFSLYMHLASVCHLYIHLYIHLSINPFIHSPSDIITNRDNFYDQTGYATDAWFSKLTLATKSKIIGSVAGNHGNHQHSSYNNIELSHHVFVVGLNASHLFPCHSLGFYHV